MNKFNLIDNSWIPVRWLDSARSDSPAFVSLHEAFTRAEEIADLDCAPLRTQVGHIDAALKAITRLR